jgi:hypothetical protein
VRGSIRSNNPWDAPRDFVITGPELQVVYGGCRFNKLVLTHTGDVDRWSAFTLFLEKVKDHVARKVAENPERFRPGSAKFPAYKFEFESPIDVTIEGREELRARLLVTRGEDEETDIVVTSFMSGGNVVDPASIKHGWHVVPLIKVAYFRTPDKFKLTFTVLKAEVIPKDVVTNDWQFDYAEV